MVTRSREPKHGCTYNFGTETVLSDIDIHPQRPNGFVVERMNVETDTQKTE